MIYEIIQPIESFLSYLNITYNEIRAIEDRYILIEKQIAWLQDEWEKEMFCTSPDYWNHEIDKLIIDSWHGSMLVLVIEILEKWLKEVAKMHNLDLSDKKIKKLKKEKIYQENDGTCFVIYQEIKKEGFSSRNDTKISGLWENINDAITARNHIAHDPWNIIDTKKYSHEQITVIAKDIEKFLKILFYKGKSWNALDYL